VVAGEPTFLKDLRIEGGGSLIVSLQGVSDGGCLGKRAEGNLSQPVCALPRPSLCHLAVDSALALALALPAIAAAKCVV
jgi:hypothetical protein